MEQILNLNKRNRFSAIHLQNVKNRLEKSGGKYSSVIFKKTRKK